MRRRGLVVGTRVHASGGGPAPDVRGLGAWCTSLLAEADGVLVAVDGALHAAALQAVAGLERVDVLHVSPWRGYTPALNALVASAARAAASHLLLRSLEVDLGAEDVRRLLGEADADTLVVGARLSPRHGGAPGTKALDGDTSPWNTLALWNVPLLSLTGFLAVSDELHPELEGGVEEVVTISMLQHLHPQRTRAKLLSLPGLRWNADWDDALRGPSHAQKLASKHRRAEAQLRHLGAPRGTVTVLAAGEERRP